MGICQWADPYVAPTADRLRNKMVGLLIADGDQWTPVTSAGD